MNPLLTLATPKERIKLSTLMALGIIADDLLLVSASSGIYRAALYVESEINILFATLNLRANRVVELCHTGK
jgi:hypothetical protein